MPEAHRGEVTCPAANDNKTKAAELLEISHKALLYKIREYGL